MPRVWVDEWVLLGTMGQRRCSECGAVLKDRSAPCPLCDSATELRRSFPKDIDRYQSDVRRLREELRKLREEVEAS